MWVDKPLWDLVGVKEWRYWLITLGILHRFYQIWDCNNKSSFLDFVNYESMQEIHVTGSSKQLQHGHF